MMQELKQLRGKKILKAELCSAAYGDCENRAISLTFTDGTEFSLDVKSRLDAKACIFTKNDKRQKIVLESD